MVDNSPLTPYEEQLLLTLVHDQRPWEKRRLIEQLSAEYGSQRLCELQEQASTSTLLKQNMIERMNAFRKG